MTASLTAVSPVAAVSASRLSRAPIPVIRRPPAEYRIRVGGRLFQGSDLRDLLRLAVAARRRQLQHRSGGGN